MIAKKPLPERLHAAWNWIESASEWDAALAMPEEYAREAAENARENDEGDVTASDLMDAIEWQRVNGPRRPALYVAKQLPTHWIAEEDGKLVAFPAQQNGWNERRTYRGHRKGLRQVPNYSGYGTGWPHATRKTASGPTQAEEDRKAVQVKLRLAPAIADELRKLAEARGQSISETVAKLVTGAR